MQNLYLVVNFSDFIASAGPVIAAGADLAFKF